MLGGADGDLYVPGRSSGGIVLVPGAALKGRNDPRVVRVARALARAGRLVFVPELELYSRRLVPSDLERIAVAVLGLGEHVGGPTTLVGFSYGGAYALVVSADPRLRDRVAGVAVFGAYFDLVGVVQAFTAGVSLVGGRRVPWPVADRGREFLPLIAAALAPPGEEEALRSALEGSLDPSALGSEARTLHGLFTNRDPAKTAGLVRTVSPQVRELFERLSPSTVSDSIRAPVFAMHSSEDPAVPYGEALRLAEGLPRAHLVTVRGFGHVDLKSAGSWTSLARDLAGAWRFSAWVLGAGR